MKTLGTSMLAAVAIAALAMIAAGGAPSAGASAPQGGGSSHTVSKADFERWKTELSNWGRWGKDDQIGALNLMTPAKRKQAFALAKEGFSVSLAADVDTEKAIDNQNPYEHSDLEELADAAPARNRWEFLLTAAPLPIRGGTGSPLNPVAVF